MNPKLEFTEKLETVVRFKYGDAKFGQGQYGPWYLYNVGTAEGDRALFGTQALHDELVAAGVGEGAGVAITKTGKDTWHVEIREHPQTPGIQVKGRDGVQAKPGDVSTSANQTASNAYSQPVTRDHGRELEDLRRLYHWCLQASWASWQQIRDGSADMQAVQGAAATIFIQACRQGLKVPAVTPEFTDSEIQQAEAAGSIPF